MKNSRMLSNLAKDVLYLYCHTHDRRVEGVFLRLAQDFETDLAKWLGSSSKMAELRKKLNNPYVLEGLLLLQRIKQENPSGISSGDMVTRYFVNTNSDTYIPVIKSFVPLMGESKVSDILAPFAQFLKQFGVFGITRPDNPASTLIDLNTVATEFTSYRGDQVNEPFDEEPSFKPQKLNKKQKQAGLLNYLTFRFAEEIAPAFEQIGRADIANAIRIGDGAYAGESLLLNPKAIYGLFPKMVGNPLALEANARIVTKEALADFEPMSYEKTYNEMRNSILLSSGAITYQQHQDFKYDQLINRSKPQVGEPIKSIPVGAMKWIYPSPIALQLASMSLFSINARINK